MTNDVFISYASADKTVADAISVALENANIRCWIAPRDVLPGEPFARAIIRAMNESRLFVLVFSAETNESDRVKNEVERAVSKGLSIVVFRVQDVVPSGEMEYYLARRHWLDAITPPLEAHLWRLTEAVAALLAKPILSTTNAVDEHMVAELSARVRDAVKQGDWTQAVTLLEQAKAVSSDDPKVAELLQVVKRDQHLAGLRRQAQERVAAQDWAGAVIALEEAVRLAPNDTDLAASLSGAYRSRLQAGSKQYDVFISYPSAQKQMADVVRATLEQNGTQCWIAPRDVMPGVSWNNAIIGALNEVRLFVLIFSAEANESEQVMREVERAVSKGLPIIVFRVKNAVPTGAMEYFLSHLHWLDATSSPIEVHLQRLVTTARALIPIPSAQAVPEATRSIRDFLSNADFAFASVDDPDDFLAMSQTSYWSGKVPTGFYVRALSHAALRPSEVQAICEKAKKHTQYALVVVDQQPDISAWMRIGELRADDEQRRFFLLPIDASLVRESCAQGDERQTFRKYIERKLGKAYDPFDSRDPVSDALSFFGREVLTEELKSALRTGQLVGLFGIHKMGKSSVLQRLKKQLEFPIAYVYLQPNDSPAELYLKLLQQWKTDLQIKLPDIQWLPPQAISSANPDMEFQTTAQDLLGKLQQVSEFPRLGIFLDEIDLWMPSRDDPKAITRYVDLMHGLRGLKQETNQLSLLVAGIHPNLSRINLLPGGIKNPMYQVVTERFLEPFSREDCRVMILSLGQQAGISFDESAVDAIYRSSGGHPYLARRLCSQAWKAHGEIGLVPLAAVTQAIAEFVRNPATASYFDDTALWGELIQDDSWGKEGSLANSSILKDLAQSSDGLAETTLMSDRNRRAIERALLALKALTRSSSRPAETTSASDLSRRAIERGLLALTERNVIQLDPASKKYFITFGLFRDWIRRYKL